jgi:hypothetical protein
MHWGWLAAAVVLAVYVWGFALGFMSNDRPVPPEVRWGARGGLAAAAACLVLAFV